MEIEVPLGRQHVLDQPVGRREQDRASRLDQAVAYGAHGVGLAGAGQSESQDIDASLDEAPIGQVVELLSERHRHPTPAPSTHASARHRGRAPGVALNGEVSVSRRRGEGSLGRKVALLWRGNPTPTRGCGQRIGAQLPTCPHRCCMGWSILSLLRCSIRTTSELTTCGSGWLLDLKSGRMIIVLNSLKLRSGLNGAGKSIYTGSGCAQDSYTLVWQLPD